MASLHPLLRLTIICGFLAPTVIASCTLDTKGELSDTVDAGAGGDTGPKFDAGGHAGSASGAAGNAGAKGGSAGAGGAAGHAGTGGVGGQATGGVAGAPLGGSAGAAKGGSAGSVTGGSAGTGVGGSAGGQTGGSGGAATGGSAGAATGGAAGALLSYSDTVLSDGPMAYWRLGETSGITAVDSTGHGHDGIYIGPCNLGVPGAINDGNTAVEFDGTSTELTVGTAFGFQGLKPFTFEAWIKPTDLPISHQHPFEKDMIDIKGRHGWGIYVHGNLGIGFERFVNDVNFVVNGPVPPTDTYTYIVGTYDGAALRLYVNGTIVQDGTVLDARPTILNSAIAYVGSAGLFSKAFPGYIDEVAIYDKALTDPAIAAHYAAGKQ